MRRRIWSIAGGMRWGRLGEVLEAVLAGVSGDIRGEGEGAAAEVAAVGGVELGCGVFGDVVYVFADGVSVRGCGECEGVRGEDFGDDAGGEWGGVWVLSVEKGGVMGCCVESSRGVRYDTTMTCIPQ